MSKKTIVTGAAGFVGAVLARRLVEEGHDVQLLVRPESHMWRLDGLDASVHRVDLNNDTHLSKILSTVRADWIFHLAAHGGYSSQVDRRRMIEANVVGTMNLVDAALRAGFEAFINTGSSSEYGFMDRAPAETERPEPNSVYALTKLTQTRFCRFAARKHDVHIPTLRLYSVYGPYEEPTRLIPTLIACGLEGRLPPLVSPDVARDFVYTDDIVEAFLMAARRNDVERGSIYNVGTGRQTTIREAVALARRMFEIAPEPEWQSMPNREWDTTSWVANVEKIQSELGWRPAVSFEEGFRRFSTWLRDNAEHYRPPS